MGHQGTRSQPRQHWRHIAEPASRLEITILALGLIAAVASGTVTYWLGGPYGEGFGDPRVWRIYDHAGQLELLIYDANGNVHLDTWAYWEADRVIRREVDENEDGVIDRWEYVGPDGDIEKVGFSTSRDAVVDAWRFLREDGTVERIEYSIRRDGQISRTEFYTGGALMRVEHDTDGDGTVDERIIYFPEPPGGGGS